jgi:hypothetical protein
MLGSLNTGSLDRNVIHRCNYDGPKEKKVYLAFKLRFSRIPPMLRDSVKNKIICGVWSGKIAIDFDIILSEFLKKIKIWSNEGVKVLINNQEKIFKIRIYDLFCDGPAKAEVLCLKYHSGYLSCPYCLLKGKNINFDLTFLCFKHLSSRRTSWVKAKNDISITAKGKHPPPEP